MSKFNLAGQRRNEIDSFWTSWENVVYCCTKNSFNEAYRSLIATWDGNFAAMGCLRYIKREWGEHFERNATAYVNPLVTFSIKSTQRCESAHSALMRNMKNHYASIDELWLSYEDLLDDQERKYRQEYNKEEVAVDIFLRTPFFLHVVQLIARRILHKVNDEIMKLDKDKEGQIKAI